MYSLMTDILSISFIGVCVCVCVRERECVSSDRKTEGAWGRAFETKSV